MATSRYSAINLIRALLLALLFPWSAQAWTGWHPVAWTNLSLASNALEQVSAWAVPVRMCVTNALPGGSNRVDCVDFLTDIYADSDGATNPPAEGPLSMAWTNTWMELDEQTNLVQVSGEYLFTDLYYVKTNLAFGVPDIRAWDCFQAVQERYRALQLAGPDTDTNALVRYGLPRLYGQNRDNLVEVKAWVAGALGSFAWNLVATNQTFDGYFLADPFTWSWEPLVTAPWVSVSSRWQKVVDRTVPTNTKERLYRAMGAPFDLVTAGATGTLAGWRIGRADLLQTNQAAHVVTNAVNGPLDFTPYGALLGQGLGFAAIKTSRFVIATSSTNVVTNLTVNTCGQDVEVSGTNGQVVLVVCTNAGIAAGATSLDYGWWSARAALTNLVQMVVPGTFGTNLNQVTERRGIQLDDASPVGCEDCEDNYVSFGYVTTDTSTGAGRGVAMAENWVTLYRDPNWIGPGGDACCWITSNAFGEASGYQLSSLDRSRLNQVRGGLVDRRVDYYGFWGMPEFAGAAVNGQRGDLVERAGWQYRNWITPELQTDVALLHSVTVPAYQVDRSPLVTLDMPAAPELVHFESLWVSDSGGYVQGYAPDRLPISGKQLYPGSAVITPDFEYR